MRRFLVATAALLGAIELRDLTFLGGVVLAGWGGAQLSGPWTAILIGSAMALLSIPRRAR